MQLQELESRPQSSLTNPCYDRWLNEDGETVTQFFRSNDGFIVRFLDQGDFAIDIRDWLVSCVPVPHADPDIIRDLYLNQIVPLILGHRGELVLHASAVASPAGALGFVGASGRGKSTLAAAFARQGYAFITDDGLLLRQDGDDYLAHPNNPRVRLRDDSEQALFGDGAADRADGMPHKRHIPASDELPFQEHPVMLRAIYLVGKGEAETTRIAHLTPAEALAALIAHSFMLDVEDRPRMRGHFTRLAELAASQPCFALDFPKRYDYLPRVIADLLDHAGSGGF